MQAAEARPHSLQDACSCPGPGGFQPCSHQAQEGSTQDPGDEPAQGAPGPAAPPGGCHRLQRILPRRLGPQEPLPGSRGPGLAEFHFQLQLGGSGAAVLLLPSFSAGPGQFLGPPDAAVAGGATSPGAAPCQGSQVQLWTPQVAAGCGRTAPARAAPALITWRKCALLPRLRRKPAVDVVA